MTRKKSKSRKKHTIISKTKKKNPIKNKISTTTKKEKTSVVVAEETYVFDCSPTKSKRPRKPRSKKFSIDRMYFTKDTENAIVRYNNTEDMHSRDNIYNTEIKYAFEKLVENVFNTFKFSYLETGPLEAQRETISHLVVNMNKFDPTMGFKAYSYFSIVAKNYLIHLNNNNYKRFNQHVDIGEEKDEHTVQLQTDDKHHKHGEMLEFVKLMVTFWEENLAKIFTKEKDLSIASAVVELFRNSESISMYNKKALYLYIREISSCRTQNITRVINTMKKYQKILTQNYCNHGYLAEEESIIQPI
jgi:hypothetical protein